MAYSSSLTDAEWEILEPLLLEILPPKKRTRPCDWTQRTIIDGILYQLKNGCNWADCVRKSWICPSCREMGDRTFQCLDGAM